MATATLTLGSQNRWLADGVTTIWNINFVGGYLSEDTVFAYSFFTDESIRINHTIEFLSEFQIRISPAVGDGYTLVVYRDSSNGGLPRADFTDGGGITEQNLDLLAKQAIFVAQETEDFIGTLTEASLAARLAEVQASAAEAEAAAASANLEAIAASTSSANALASETAAAASAVAASLAEAVVLDAAATAASSTETLIDTFTATAGQTDFTLSTAPSSINNIRVYLDGIRLTRTTDYTWPSSLVVRLVSGAAVGQEVMVEHAKSVTTSSILSTAVGEGATKVGSSDVGGYYVSGNVEGQLQEVGYKWANGFALGNSLVRLEPGNLTSFLAFRAVNNNDTARVYVVPKGKVAGVPAAIKIFMDDYQAEVLAGTVNYRDCGIYGDKAIKGINGAGSWLINSKSNGNYFAHMPQIGISRSDGNEVNFRVATVFTGTTEALMATYSLNYIGQWEASTVVAAGATCSYGLNSYTTVAGGTTGASPPVHAAGSVSDGGVTWDFLWDNSSGGTGVAIRQWVIIGNKDDVPVWTGNTRVKDAVLHLTRDAVQYPQKRLIYTRTLGDITALVGTKTSADYSWYVTDKTDTFGLRLNLDATSPFVQHMGLAEAVSAKTITTITAVPDCSGAKKIIFNAAGANSVTGFGSQPAHGIILVSSGNSNTTLVHSASPGTVGSPTIYLNTGANKTLSNRSLLQFSLNSSGDQWIEVGSL